MAVYIYGKSLPVKWRAFAGEGISPGDGVAIAELVNARLYRNPPTTAELDDYTAAILTYTGTPKTTFSAQDATNLIYTVTYDPVSDPEPHSSLLYDTWHPVWNVRYQASQQIDQLYKPIEIWRPVPQLWQLDIDYDDVYALEGDIQKHLGNTRTTAKIVSAKERIFRRVKNMGLDRARLQEIDLNEAVTYLAAAFSLRDMATKNNTYEAKANYWEGKYEDLWAGLKLGYDADNDGDIEPSEKANRYRTVRFVI